VVLATSRLFSTYKGEAAKGLRKLDMSLLKGLESNPPGSSTTHSHVTDRQEGIVLSYKLGSGQTNDLVAHELQRGKGRPEREESRNELSVALNTSPTAIETHLHPFVIIIGKVRRLLEVAMLLLVITRVRTDAVELGLVWREIEKDRELMDFKMK
jgi:hypothetical protein